MIAIDSSALVAIVIAEPERKEFLEIIGRNDGSAISAVSLLETRLVLRSRFGTIAIENFNALLQEIGSEIVPFDEQQADAAFEAFETYGKGMHATARLNFGDCASYALAKTRVLPLLYKGDDFAATDIVAAG